MNCPRCSQPLPADAKFCLNCGERVAAARPLEGERRVVTVLFCDVRGSTTMAEALDPEDWSEIMDGAFRFLTEPVTRYDGTVARLMGDALLAYFGAPTAHEDDPERAILAALDMHDAVPAYRERLRRERGIGEFDIRVGINTGLAVVGDVGGAGIEYSAMGDAVNVAARLQSAAAPGEIVVGDATRKRVEGLFEFAPLGGLEVKGRSAPVEAHRVVARLRERATARRAPLVGRARELATLRDAVRDVATGRGRIVSLIGDAGMGKTRLVEELRSMWLAQDGDPGVRWSEARAQSYGASRPLLLFRQHLLAWAGAVETDENATVRDKVAALVTASGIDRADPDFAALEVALGLSDGGPAGEIGGESLRTQLFALVTRLAKSRFQGAPGVMVLDDLQWSDPASVDLLIHLFALCDEVPVLFLCAFRPDRQSVAWRAHQTAQTDYPHLHAEVTLGTLPDDDAALLLSGLLGGAELPAAVSALILSKAEGNPLFVEEIVGSLVQEGVIVQDGGGAHVTRDVADVSLPATLQGLLSARIDRLEEEPRRTLQAAAVIGRSFAYRVLRVIDEGERLDRHLGTLQRVELVRELARDPERLYGFRHALTQEAAYSSILQRRRRELHRRVAESLVELYPDRSEEQAELVGHHFAEAGDERAVKYLRLAGERALRLYALDGAIAQLDTAVEMSRRFTVDGETLAAIHAALGRAHELRGEYDAALAGYEELERIGAERGDKAMQAAAISYRTTVLAHPTAKQDLAAAGALLERGIPLAREAGRPDLLARLYWNRGTYSSWTGNLEMAINSGEEAVRLAREAGQRELLAFALTDLSRAYRSAGQNDRSLERLSEGLDLFRALGNKPMAADALGTLTYFHYGQGEFEKALETSAEARRLSDETGNLWGQSFSGFTRAMVFMDQGDWGQAIQIWEEAVRLGERAGFVVVQVGPRGQLGWVYHLAGDDERAEGHIRAAIELGERSMKSWLVWPMALLGRLEAARGRLDDARAVLERSRHLERPVQIPVGDLYINILEADIALAAGDHGTALRLARDGLAKMEGHSYQPPFLEWGWFEGEALRRAGDLSAAATSLEAAAERARALGADRFVLTALSSLALTERARGNETAAERARSDARRIAASIARSLEPVGLADRFRALAEVKALVPD